MLTVHDVAIEIAGRPLLQRVAFEARRGEVVAVIGANGVGKSTLLRTIAGLARLAAGSIALEGHELATLPPRERAQRVALVAGDDALLEGMTVREAVAAGRYAHHPWWDWHESAADERAIDAAVDDVEMHAAVDRSLASLSSGERQRVWIALALAQESQLLLLDEPTSHLDVRYAVETLTLLRRVARDGRIVVAVLHALEEAAEFADRVLVLGEGTSLAFGRPLEVLDSAVLSRAYRLNLEVVRSEGALLFRRKTPEP